MSQSTLLLQYVLMQFKIILYLYSSHSIWGLLSQACPLLGLPMAMSDNWWQPWDFGALYPEFPEDLRSKFLILSSASFFWPEKWSKYRLFILRKGRGPRESPSLWEPSPKPNTCHIECHVALMVSLFLSHCLIPSWNQVLLQKWPFITPQTYQTLPSSPVCLCSSFCAIHFLLLCTSHPSRFPINLTFFGQPSWFPQVTFTALSFESPVFTIHSFTDESIPTLCICLHGGLLFQMYFSAFPMEHEIFGCD